MNTKKLVLLALLLTSTFTGISAQAQNCVDNDQNATCSTNNSPDEDRIFLNVENKTYSEYSLTGTCEDETCETMNFEYKRYGVTIDSRTITKKAILALAERKLKLIYTCSLSEKVFPFSVTRSMLLDAKRNFSEGRYGLFVFNALLAPVAAVIETPFIPMETAIALPCLEIEDKQAIQNARTMLKHLEDEKVELKDKQFNKLVRSFLNHLVDRH